MIIRKELYGLKSSGSAFRSLLAKTIWELVFMSSKDDPDVRLRPESKEDGEEYYEMLLV